MQDAKPKAVTPTFVNCGGCDAELPSQNIARRIPVDARNVPLCGACADVPLDRITRSIREAMAKARENELKAA